MKTLPARINDLKIKMTCTYGNREPVTDDMANMDPWTCKLSRSEDGKRFALTVPFFMGMGHYGKAPDTATVLNCLISDAGSVEDASSFAEWASELGYDPDSRKAEKIFKACKRGQVHLKRFLGVHYEDFLWETEGY